MVVAGEPQLGVLVILKDSARNCNFIDSRMKKSLKSERSIFLPDGPNKILCPSFPSVPNVWARKAVVSNHCEMLCADVPGVSAFGRSEVTPREFCFGWPLRIVKGCPDAYE